MNPDIVGLGNGAVFGRAVLEFLKREYPGRDPRAVVQSWNQRSLRLTRRLGFVDVGELTCVQQGERVAYRIVVSCGDNNL